MKLNPEFHRRFFQKFVVAFYYTSKQNWWPKHKWEIQEHMSDRWQEHIWKEKNLNQDSKNFSLSLRTTSFSWLQGSCLYKYKNSCARQKSLFTLCMHSKHRKMSTNVVDSVDSLSSWASNFLPAYTEEESNRRKENRWVWVTCKDALMQLLG